MYKSNKSRRLAKPPSIPQRVIISQQPLETYDKENNSDEDVIPNSQQSQGQDHEIPSSQNENVTQNSIVSQSRFLSQRHQISRLIQDHDIRGKNYFEIALISCKVQITEIGEFLWIS